MIPLTKDQESFIALMKKSDEHALRGFELLAKRNDLDNFFDAVDAAGLLSPENNPAPVPVEPEGSVRIPFWPALGYLVACATAANKRNDDVLAQKVMRIVRAATAFREPDGKIRDNYHTFARFAEILGILPASSVSTADVDLVATWLLSRFDNDGVARALDTGAIPRFLGSDQPGDWQKAAALIRHCLTLKWEAKKARGLDEEEPVTLVDPYWLQDLISHHAHALGRKIGSQAATFFRDAVAQLFGRGGRAAWSYLFRPAVEDHSQNHSWKKSENAFVEGLRDVLLSWSETNPTEAKAFIKEMLTHEVEMVRRIAIFIVNERWEQFRDLYPEMLSPTFFKSGHIHELYNLLSRRFDVFDVEYKKATLDVIRQLPEPEGDDSRNRLKRIQRRWLESLSSTNFEGATNWLKELQEDPNIGVPEHPDFNSYMETGWGPGRSPYELQELVAFAEQRTLADRLKAFTPANEWRAPTAEALVETLGRAVEAAPRSFAGILPSLVDAEPRYQTAVINGFKRLWEADRVGTSTQPALDWQAVWPLLFDFFEAVFRDPTISGEKSEASSWLLSVVADMLEAGVKSDEHAYPAGLLPRGWALLNTLIDRAHGTQSPDDEDPMTAAINSPRGHVIEAAVNHALRVCRLADRETGSHTAIWDTLRQFFDAELQKTSDGNYEFATLLGAYLANFDYMDSAWVSSNLPSMFPIGRPQFQCAMGGLAFSPPTDRTYGMLRDAGIVDAALESDLQGRDTREKFIERLAVAYLRGQDSLARWSYLFDHALTGDLEHAAFYMGSLEGETVTDPQKAKILEFFDRCVTWAQGQATPPTSLLSSLSGLAWVLEDATGRNRELLMAVAPYVKRHHRTYEFLSELGRLIERNRDETAEVLDRIIDTHGDAFYDYEDRLKSLVERLFDLGDRPRALALCNRLRYVNGMMELFVKLSAKAQI
jgi:hypothetical protein